MMLNSSAKNGKEKAKEKENKVGGSSEKEQPPVFLADIKSLRSIFEGELIRKEVSKRSQPTPPPDEPTPKATPTVPQKAVRSQLTPPSVEPPAKVKATPTVPQKAAGHDKEDVVDCSQPSMEDLLTKFRRLELEADKMRTEEKGRPRKLQADEYVQRSASLDRKANLTYDRTKVKEPSSSTVKGLTIDERLEAAKTAKRSAGQQPQKPPAKSLPEAETVSGAKSSKKESDVIANGYNVSVDSIKRSLGGAAVKQTVDKQVVHEELPFEGTVKALLSQWKSMENISENNSLRKKKRVSFGVDSSWLPDDQPTPVNNKTSKPNKSCLKLKTPPTTAAASKKNDKPTTPTTAQDSKKTLVQEEKVPSKAPKTTTIQPVRRSNSIKSKTPPPTPPPPPPPPPPPTPTPPDIVSQVSQIENKPADELPPPSNTKALLEKFRAMQVKTST